ncbi:required for drug-induced death protein 1 isoform X1 [Ovis canadensis]|uniref:required for drug-induced death protein 1 isoform X1 n=1 Tax=Ovis canadensis TaxID=37174 RepID=UPI003753E36E
MTVGARLRSKAASSLPRCGPLARGRGRTEGDEEAAAILEHLESGAEAAESEGSARRPESRGARRVHLAVLPERYEPLEEQVPSEKPKKRYRKKLKKYGKAPVTTSNHEEERCFKWNYIQRALLLLTLWIQFDLPMALFPNT